jgi:fructose-bisphosphate aldolase class I
MTSILNDSARALVAGGRGILAADETVPTISKRLGARKVESTAESRRAYREMLFSTPNIAQFIGGAILQDETIRQKSSTGRPLLAFLADRGILPGVKVDGGAYPMAGAPGEFVTEGLDGLRRRLEEYREMGARFAKWRAVLPIGDRRPTAKCVHANAVMLARYASTCQEQDLVPIIEPEVLMIGAHTLERCEEATGYVLRAVFEALHENNVSLEAMLLKSNMVLSGKECPRQASVQQVASSTRRILARHVPPAVPAIVFLSGGQDYVQATERLSAINQLDGPKPWTLSFSYGRALQDEALEAWRGKNENVAAGQHAFRHRAEFVSAAALGKYRSAMERDAA